MSQTVSIRSSFYTNRSKKWNEQPTIRRGDLASTPWLFVSSECDLEDMLVYKTSGTSGEAMDILFDPVSQASWLPQLESVLDSYNIQITKSPGITAIALVSAQQTMLTYASLSTYLNGAGILKLNLNPADWADPAHRIRYLEKFNPEIITGDPFSFLELLSLRPRIKPKAMVSSAMKLTKGIQLKLEEYFECRVFDLYSLTECKMIAVAHNEELHKAIRPDLYLEIFHVKEDKLVAEGERGELVVTGGNNPFLPLIRYRTGDFCSLIMKNGIPYLKNLEARSPVPFYNAKNKLITTVDISRVLSRFELARYTLHQNQDFTVKVEMWSKVVDKGQVESILKELFGEVPVEVTIQNSNASNYSKSITYSSDFKV